MESIVERDVPLAPLTWFGVGGPARWLVRPRSETELAEVLRRTHVEGIPVYVLGRGANLLVSDEGVDGVVIRLDDSAFRRVRIEGESVTAGGGADMAKLTLKTVHSGLGGLECMAGIPGTVGGCVRMNAGGRFGEIGRVVERVRGLDYGGNGWERRRGEIGFRYRHSGIRDVIVVEVDLGLQRVDGDELLRRYEEIWAYKQASQPLADKSAGCIFKNPAGASAGALIDRAGCKGLRCGQAWVSEQHANFILASRNGMARDVLAVIDAVRERVWEAFEVELELEVEVWGASSAKIGREAVAMA